MSPHIGIAVFSQALVIKPINLCYLSTLMVPSENCNTIPVPELQSDEKGDRLHRVISTVNVVTHEKIISVRRITPDAKEF